MIDLVLAKLTQGLAVMIGRPPPPAAPKSDHRDDRPCHSEVAGQTPSLQNVERAYQRYAAEKLDSNVQKLATKDP